jgi:hypothetical protein
VKSLYNNEKITCFVGLEKLKDLSIVKNVSAIAEVTYLCYRGVRWLLEKSEERTAPVASPRQQPRLENIPVLTGDNPIFATYAPVLGACDPYTDGYDFSALHTLTVNGNLLDGTNHASLYSRNTR